MRSWRKKRQVCRCGRDKVFIADFYKYAFVGLMLDWIRKGMKEDPNAIMRDLSLLLQGNMRAALERYRTDK